MINLDNKTWLLAMELFDGKHGVMKNIKIVNDIIVNMGKLPKDMHFEIRRAKALEIIAEELIRHNNYIEEYRTELKGANRIKVNLDSLKCPKGFTKKVMGEIKREGR